MDKVTKNSISQQTFFGGLWHCLPLYVFKNICNGAPYNFWMKILMIKWKFIGLGTVFALFLNEYYGILTKVNKRHYMSKVLNLRCHIPPNWWQYIRYKLCGPHSSYLFSNCGIHFATGLGHSRILNHWNTKLCFNHSNKLTPNPLLVGKGWSFAISFLALWKIPPNTNKAKSII